MGIDHQSDPVSLTTGSKEKEALIGNRRFDRQNYKLFGLTGFRTVSQSSCTQHKTMHKSRTLVTP